MAKQIAEKTSMEQQARKQAYEEEQWKLKARTSKIRHKIAVISGKGGVGKSTDRSIISKDFMKVKSLK